ncbi:MAG: acetyl-CoA carboxylase carboxyltransferase subunit alpha [Chlamydiales bacterium]|nr:acetyl-CoA carboxylase carboxyltransferase subunit alpha [Chlamydiales bacterium]
MDVLPHEKQIQEYIKTIERLKKQDDKLFGREIDTLEAKVADLKEKVYATLSPWERVQISRHSSRPHTIDYVTKMCDDFTELCGDRNFGEDHAIIGGLALIGNMRCVLIGQEKGHDTESRLHRNFGMMRPEGFRKALRLMQLAEKFNLPVVSLVDTPGAYAVLEAEQRGQAWAIATNLREMASLKTPIIVVVIGEGCSGGALGIAVGDVIGMLEHAYYSVISPESCASILYKDPTKKNIAAAALKLTSEEVLGLEVIDVIIKEPIGGSHQDPEHTLGAVKQFIIEQWEQLKDLPADVLVERRYLKFRRMGAFQYGEK